MARQVETTTEQIILETAERLFLEKGFAMTSTVEIAKEAGCNQALVHYYFRTKERLFEAIFEKKIKMFASPFLNEKDESIPFEEGLKIIIERHFDLIRKNPKVPFFLFNELLTNPERLKSLKIKLGEMPQSILTRLEEKLKNEIEKGTIRPIETIDLFLMIISMNVTLFIVRPILQEVTTITNEDFDRLIEKRKHENVLFILRSIKP